MKNIYTATVNVT